METETEQSWFRTRSTQPALASHLPADFASEPLGPTTAVASAASLRSPDCYLVYSRKRADFRVQIERELPEVGIQTKYVDARGSLFSLLSSFELACLLRACYSTSPLFNLGGAAT